MPNHARPHVGAQARPAAPAGYVLRGDEAADRTRQAVLGSNLVVSPFAGVNYADPRLVDPKMHELVEEAREEARRLGYADGQAEGYEDGRIAGLEMMDGQIRELRAKADAEREATNAQARARFEALCENSTHAVADALVYQLPLIEELRDLVATLAVDIAEELVGHHLQVDGCAAVDAVRRSLEAVPKHMAVRLRLHPSDASTVAEFIEGQPDSSLFTITPDPEVQPGDAVAEAENLEVEACLTDALEAVRKVLHP